MTSPDNWGDLLHPILATTVASNISGSTIGVNAIGNATGPLPPANGSSYYETNPFTVDQIKGEMFTAELHEKEIFNYHDALYEDAIKYELGQKLIMALKASNYIEYTKQVNTSDMSFIYRARIFAVPNADVQIIRKQGINENI